MTNVLVLVGSLRAGSINRKLAEAAEQHAPEGIALSTYDAITDLPFYNEDIDGETPPAAAVAFREALAAADAVLLVTPEYNGTIPAVLKNALDWASRPFGASPISGKPLAVIGSAFGQYGGVWAHDDARKVAGIAGAKVLEDVKVAIPQSVVRFAETHPREDDEVVSLVQDALRALADAASEPVAA
ncbi:NAD(P)H-dependent FMN reductase [Curtobacterium luteum]|uniref:FMN reductase n=1 Tax=Curtobacterium luteum TaxID=33881 RepID=A0A8H9GDC6_9MICO|nr:MULTISPECIES: NAD(P)H-dependent oxidoreductase [Curtobacterium]MBM7803709.1 NAD(P)H-dependent FMN reductase [Curtobacterium luteum]NUU51566.1 NAD(P)H-dependent oxidoreductase [Curtobacterium luteum]GGL03079.1 FMN reductase [Curtobacterium luteum]